MGLFSKRSISQLRVDIHSHLIPGIDDGVKSVEEAIEILAFLSSAGYRKVITTPHIKSDRYPNTLSTIKEGLQKVKESILQSKLDIELDAAAEYYIDETFLQGIMSKNEMLTFGDNFLLVETSFYSKPINMKEIIFEINSSGYQPVLAHPERYQYLEDDLFWLKSLKDMGVKLQVTLTSLMGYYGEIPMKMGRKLIDEDMVDFLGTDIHHSRQIALNGKALEDMYILRALKRGVQNNQLLSE